ncbi:MAG TPA: RNA polymerase sigma factor [Candidatus Krumholzibacteria bacterium]|nr:RNA polymerase sigma factor [Candidatus Krumholzibacteria bacterium]
MPQSHDSELVARAQANDERAFRELIERYHAMAYAAVRAVLGDRDEVQDVMQMVYLKAYQGLAGFRGDAKFSTWLYQIARREALDVSSKRRVETVDVEALELAGPAHNGADVAAHERSEREWVGAALAELDEAYRTAIELRYMAEKSYEEIAEVMGVPVGTVKTYVHRGKAEMKRILSRPAWRAGAANERKS